jgi:N-formylglutamate deformylase
VKKLNTLPEWVILHLPHDSVAIPDSVRRQFVLDDAALKNELLRMTDHFTGELFRGIFPPKQVVRAGVSRLVVDVERFDDDSMEPMAARGMGAVYMKTHSAEVLRFPVSDEQRAALLEAYYYPHHQALTMAVNRALDGHNRSLLIDAHSFPAKPLPYEVDQTSARPEICIGTDDFHTSADLLLHFENAFRTSGFTTAVNKPFSGALVPRRFYGIDSRVSSIMIEIRRDIYMNELTGQRLAGIANVTGRIQAALSAGVAGWVDKTKFL